MTPPSSTQTTPEGAAGRRAGLVAIAWLTATAWVVAPSASAQAATDPPPVAALPQLNLPAYVGTWYQVALFPNSFQKQCVSDTTATYEAQPDQTIRVRNRCKLADGRFDEAIGVARPVGRIEGDWLRPAQLTVSFLPGWLQWLPVGRGHYWVIQRPEDGRYAVISEPTRQYLWVLSRTPGLSAADETAIRSQLLSQGFDLSRWTAHGHGQAPAGASPQKP